MEHLTIGQLATHAHVNRETVRYYERRRLLPPPARLMSGYRVFSHEAVKQLRFIRRAKVLGFSLEEIRELLALRVDSIGACDRVRRRTQAKIADIDTRIKSLVRMRRALIELVAACERRGRTNGCPILDSLEAPREELNESRTTLHTRLPKPSNRRAVARGNPE